MKRNNKGLSIVELVIVMAIISIVVGFSLYSISNIRNYRARECSRKITSSLAEAKITTLGKAKSTGDIVWELYNDNGAIYVRTMQNCKNAPAEMKETKVSKGTVRSLTVLAGGAGGTAKMNVASGQSVKLCYNRASGALYTCGGAVVSAKGTGTAAQYTAGSSLSVVKGIVVSNGLKDYTTEIVPSTGKVKGGF